MSIITKVLKQTCVYWAPTGFDEFGQRQYGAAVELKCRWTDVMKEVVAPDGTMVISKSEVMVSTDVKTGGVLKFGELDEVHYINEPTRNEGAYPIIQFAKVPNFKCTEYVRSAYL